MEEGRSSVCTVDFYSHILPVSCTITDINEKSRQGCFFCPWHTQHGEFKKKNKKNTRAECHHWERKYLVAEKFDFSVLIQSRCLTQNKKQTKLLKTNMPTLLGQLSTHCIAQRCAKMSLGAIDSNRNSTGSLLFWMKAFTDSSKIMTVSWQPNTKKLVSSVELFILAWHACRCFCVFTMHGVHCFVFSSFPCKRAIHIAKPVRRHHSGANKHDTF